MDTALRVVSEVVLAYFFAINLVDTALLVISVHESREHGRRLSFGGFDVILRSPLTLPVSVLMPRTTRRAPSCRRSRPSFCRSTASSRSS